ncbi:helix-turn-helix domain-containing protein [Paenibacillus sp. GSMTC-2017]|nr:helix-turn-helix domain-containing protein [Paenibacillus sp. GSMTC-2017]MBH5316346.1 helix-turn-helix domain-containing protein [Paenibacillus sp. GSMTC-2017]
MNRDFATIGYYVQAYQAAGLEGLRMQHYPGRPTRLTTND